MTTEAPAAAPPRVRAGALLSTCGALGLAFCMLATRWYGVIGLPRSADRSGIQTAASVWHELTLARWVLLAAVLAPLGSVALHVSQRSHGTRTDTSRATAALGSLAALALVYRVLINLPSPTSVVDVKIGAYVGLLSAVAIALGGFESIREERARQQRATRRARTSTALASRP